MSAVGRRQCRALLALEVIMEGQFPIVPGKDQIDAGPLELSVKEQVRVRDDNRIRWSVRSVDGLDVEVAVGIQARPVSGSLGVKFAIGVEFARIIQGTPQWLIISNFGLSPISPGGVLRNHLLLVREPCRLPSPQRQEKSARPILRKYKYLSPYR